MRDGVVDGWTGNRDECDRNADREEYVREPQPFCSLGHPGREAIAGWPGASALIKSMPPTPRNGSTATAITTMPIPPYHWVI